MKPLRCIHTFKALYLDSNETNPSVKMGCLWKSLGYIYIICIHIIYIYPYRVCYMNVIISTQIDFVLTHQHPTPCLVLPLPIAAYA